MAFQGCAVFSSSHMTHTFVSKIEKFFLHCRLFFNEIKERPSVEDRPFCFVAGIIAWAVFFCLFRQYISAKCRPVQYF